MCRLFGLNGGTTPVHASYWLLSAPDSMAIESQRNPDGTGVGWFDVAGHGDIRKWPEQALEDDEFRREALGVQATTMVTHVRAATTGRRSVENCHPFLIENRLMAHNGGFHDLPAVEAELGDYMRFVRGDTDSERYAALIAKYTDAHDGDVTAGLAAAAAWLAENVPLYSLNTIVATPGQLWALRYPDQRALHVATRTITPDTGSPDPDWVGSTNVSEHHINATSGEPVTAVIVASERIDDSADWRMLAPGELLHVGEDLSQDSRIAVDHPPATFQKPAEADPNLDGF